MNIQPIHNARAPGICIARGILHWPSPEAKLPPYPTPNGIRRISRAPRAILGRVGVVLKILTVCNAEPDGNHHSLQPNDDSTLLRG